MVNETCVGTGSASKDLIQTLHVGPIATNCYVMDDGAGGVIVIDPGGSPARIVAALQNRPVHLVLVTHAHFDHIGALADIAALSRDGWVLGKDDVPALTDAHLNASASFGRALTYRYLPQRQLSDADVVNVGDLSFQVIACPGHTPGGVAYHEAAHGILFSGDTLFAGTCGRCDLPGGDPCAMRNTLARLALLPGETIVYPGHGPLTSIGQEFQLQV